MKKLFLFCVFCLLIVGGIFSQNAPDWMDSDFRKLQYPSSVYITGFASGNVLAGEDIAKAAERIKSVAQSDLLESIRVNMKSSSHSSISSSSVNGKYYEEESFNNASSKSIKAEIVGMKVETYYNSKTKNMYAFAFANRNDVIAYYKGLLSSDILQIEGYYNAAQKLYGQNDRAAARLQCQAALSLFSKVAESQGMLVAVNPQMSASDLQDAKVRLMYDGLLQLQSKLDPKFELVERLQSSLLQKLSQAESYLNTSKNLIDDGEKSKARTQCELARKMLDEIRVVQDSLQLVEPTISSDKLERVRTENLHNDVNILSARLAQAVMVYVENDEDLFGQKVNVVANKLKSQMSVSGCGFTDDESQADFKLTLKASTRESSATESIVFCYADVSYDLYDENKQKSVYSDDISEKGGSISKEKASRKAMENAANKIMESIAPWLK